MFRGRPFALQWLACVVAACAAEPSPAPRAGFGVASESYVGDTGATRAGPVAAAGPSIEAAALLPAVAEADAGAGTPHTATTATFDAAAEERHLREEIALRGDPAEPALDLAGLLCSLERHDEALAVIDAVRERSKDARLRVARAGLLRDLGRRDLAAQELRALVHERGAADLHPSLLLEWAELEWLGGDFAAAGEALRTMHDAHRDDPWLAANAESIDTISRAVARENRSAKGVRDLLGDLRGGTTTAVRLTAFESLVTIARLQPERAPGLFDQAVAIALGDDGADLRARAVAIAEPGAADAKELLASALQDEAAAVRLAAGKRAVALGGTRTLLLERLALEADPAVFLQLHRSLAELVGAAPAVPADGAASAESRAALVGAWRERCSP